VRAVAKIVTFSGEWTLRAKGPWLAFGTDTLIQAMPVSARTSAAGIEFAPDGEVVVGPGSARWRRRG
jgi:Chloramphenicol phosphotransferase-like protein